MIGHSYRFADGVVLRRVYDHLAFKGNASVFYFEAVYINIGSGYTKNGSTIASRFAQEYVRIRKYSHIASFAHLVYWMIRATSAFCRSF